MIYIVFGLLIILFCYMEVLDNERSMSGFFLMFFLVLMVFFAGLRNEVGIDWVAYYINYKFQLRQVEIGYTFVSTVFSSLKIHYNIFLLFINSVSLLLMYYFFKRNSPYLVICVLIFFSDLFLYYNLSGIRQAIATSITCFSFTYALNRKLYKFLILVGIAACFHSTAIVFAALYFIPRKVLSLKYYVYAFFGFFALTFLLNKITDLIFLYTLKDANFYINLQGKDSNLVNLFMVGIVKRFIIIGVILFYCKQFFDYEKLRYLFNIYLFGLALYIATYNISPDIGVRLSTYFTIFDTIIAGNIILLVRRTNMRMIIVTIFTIVAIYKLFGYVNMVEYNYKTIL
jgi:EpsG family